MPLVRVTMNPSEVLSVSATELADLAAQGVVYDDYEDLYVNFYDYEGGCAVDLAATPSVEVIGPSPAITEAVAETTTGVTRIGVGRFVYRWREEGQLAPDSGTYAVNWAGIDVNAEAVTATEEVVVP